MKIGEAIKTVMESKGIRVVDLMRLTGLAQNTVTNRLSGDRNLSLNKVDELLHAVGYKMLIVPEEVPERNGWIRIDSKQYSGDDDGKGY